MGTPFIPTLRFQNLFGSPEEQVDPRVNLNTGAGTFSGQPVTGYEPEMRAQNKLYELLDQIPERNKPGILRKIAAAAANIGGMPEQSEMAMYGPYHRGMQDFQAQFKPTLDVAQQERLHNNQLRQIATDASRAQATDRRLDIQQGELQRKETLDKANIATREKRAATYDWKARNPNAVIKVDEEGRLVGINPQTGQGTFITGPDGQPIKSNELSAEEKANLQIEVAQARARATGDQQIRVEGVRQANREKLVNLRAEKRAKAKETERISVTQDAAAWKLARQQFIADHPHYSHLWDEQGNPKPEGSDEDDYADAVEQIRERYNTIKARAGGKTTKPGARAAPKAPPGWKYVPKAGGGWTAVEDKGTK